MDNNPVINNQNQDPQPSDRVSSTLTVTQPGETTICTIKRHPVGILMVFVAAALLLIVGAVLVFGVLPRIAPGTSGNGSQALRIGAVVYLIAAAVSVGFVFIAQKVYWGNSWVITSDSVTQISQKSLFDRQSSQLSLGNLEDVTSEQNGILAHMFNYGVLRVETAGERSKFFFMYCPNPNYYAQQILGAREAFEQRPKSPNSPSTNTE